MADRSAIEWTEATWNPVTESPFGQFGDGVRRSLGGRESGAAALAESLRAVVHRLDHPDVLDQPIRFGDLSTRQARLDALRDDAVVGDGRSHERRQTTE